MLFISFFFTSHFLTNDFLADFLSFLMENQKLEDMEQHVKGVVINAAVSEPIVCEGLTERNMSMQEKLDSLRVTIMDLENVRRLNNELENQRH